MNPELLDLRAQTQRLQLKPLPTPSSISFWNDLFLAKPWKIQDWRIAGSQGHQREKTHSCQRYFRNMGQFTPSGEHEWEWGNGLTSSRGHGTGKWCQHILFLRKTKFGAMPLCLCCFSAILGPLTAAGICLDPEVRNPLHRSIQNSTVVVTHTNPRCLSWFKEMPKKRSVFTCLQPRWSPRESHFVFF